MRETLAARRRHLDLLAHALLDKEVLERAAIEELLATSPQTLAPVGIATAGQSSAAA